MPWMLRSAPLMVIIFLIRYVLLVLNFTLGGDNPEFDGIYPDPLPGGFKGIVVLPM